MRLQRHSGRYKAAEPKDFIKLREDLYVARMTQAFRLKDIYDATDLEADGLDGRYAELFRPIIAMSRLMGTEEEAQNIFKYAMIYQRNKMVGAANVQEEANILSTMESWIREDGWYSITELAIMIMKDYGEKWTPKHTSSVLDRLGFQDRRRTAKRMLFHATPQRIEDMMKTYGIWEDKTEEPIIGQQALTKSVYETIQGT